MGQSFRGKGRIGRPALLLCVAATMGGCDSLKALGDRIGGGDAPEIGAASPSGRLRLEERDIESPAVFAMTDTGIWDGRPSFGGVWVAVPGSIQPERVRIVNTANGQATVGSLFKREDARPGPKIELSSDAAAALGALPGQPVTLQIVALRRETVELPPDMTDPVPPPAPSAATETISATPLAAPQVSAETVASPAARPEAQAPAATAPVPAAAPAASTLARPYVQVGTFASEANATGLVEILGKNNVTAEVQRLTGGERVLYRVLAGPAASESDRKVIAARVAALGFTDAFPATK